MAPSNPATQASRRPVTYRTLAGFWALLLGASAVGAITLQVLGPVGQSAPGTSDKPGKPAQPAAPAAMPPTPAEKPAVTIAPPSADLLESLSATDFPELPAAKLPKIAANGNDWPAKHYAAPFDPMDRHPHVVVVVSGAGLDQELTRNLLRNTPAAVDVVFSAYMPPERADSLAEAARQTGHECLLSIPMEPNIAPMHDEGPRQLTGDLQEDQYTQNLYWSLSRLGGCIGATGAADNGMRGDRYAQSDKFAGLLVDVTKRGLMYLDPLTRTTVLYPAGTNAPELPTPGNIDLVRKTAMVLDEQVQYGEALGEAEIRKKLDMLTSLAAPDQPPIGLALNLNQKLIDILHDWANTLPAKGVTLMPLSATPKMPPPSPLDVISPAGDQK